MSSINNTFFLLAVLVWLCIIILCRPKSIIDDKCLETFLNEAKQRLPILLIIYYKRYNMIPPYNYVMLHSINGTYHMFYVEKNNTIPIHKGQCEESPKLYQYDIALQKFQRRSTNYRLKARNNRIIIELSTNTNIELFTGDNFVKFKTNDHNYEIETDSVQVCVVDKICEYDDINNINERVPITINFLNDRFSNKHFNVIEKNNGNRQIENSTIDGANVRTVGKPYKYGYILCNIRDDPILQNCPNEHQFNGVQCEPLNNCVDKFPGFLYNSNESSQAYYICDENLEPMLTFCDLNYYFNGIKCVPEDLCLNKEDGSRYVVEANDDNNNTYIECIQNKSNIRYCKTGLTNSKLSCNDIECIEPGIKFSTFADSFPIPSEEIICSDGKLIEHIVCHISYRVLNFKFRLSVHENINIYTNRSYNFKMIFYIPDQYYNAEQKKCTLLMKEHINDNLNIYPKTLPLDPTFIHISFPHIFYDVNVKDAHALLVKYFDVEDEIPIEIDMPELEFGSYSSLHMNNDLIHFIPFTNTQYMFKRINNTKLLKRIDIEKPVAIYSDIVFELNLSMLEHFTPPPLELEDIVQPRIVSQLIDFKDGVTKPFAMVCTMLGVHILDYIIIADDDDDIVEKENVDITKMDEGCNFFNIGTIKGIYVYNDLTKLWCNDKKQAIPETDLPCVKNWKFTISHEAFNMQCSEQNFKPVWFDEIHNVNQKWTGTYYGINSDYSILDKILEIK